MVWILFFFLNDVIDEAISNNSPLGKFNQFRERIKDKNERERAKAKNKSKTKIATTSLNNIGNTAVSRYSKHSYREKSMYGIDIISIVKIMPINNKFLLMMILSF